ncbi:MAG: excinuclease ABC subunit UvrA [Bacteroidetes bacterium]|nr:excinuclease ABC subunit UvrA [Bacteroidota bacterium]HET6243603.1 excinuclease ABC subunit UvrA [Bacteroidia bacterium]
MENGIETLEVSGARVHNLKNIDVSIPRNKLVVITGLSGSGKSSLAFDTIYAEGQRRYIETFSAYARSFLGNLERPDVDNITGLSPVISIEQKTVSRNPRSTVGTITEIYDFLRLLFARASDAFSYKTGEKMIRYNDQEILNIILDQYNEKRIILLSPLVKGRKGHYRELFEQILKQGFIKVRVDGEIKDIIPRLQVDRYKIHDIEIVVDRVIVSEELRQRILESLLIAMKKGKGTLMIMDVDTQEIRHFSRHLMCPTTGIAYDEPAPNIFSFNSPYGACEKCNGMGEVSQVDIKKIIPNPKLSIKKGGIAPIGEYKNNWIFHQVEAILEKYGYTLTDSIESIDEHTMNTILFGTDEVIKVKSHSGISGSSFSLTFEGIINFISRLNQENATASISRWSSEFMNTVACPECQGKRLKKESLFFKIGDKNIADLASMGITELQQWFTDIESRLDDRKNIIAKEVLKEIRSRISFLLDVGLTYLTLNRSAKTLSGGEAQRIRLATQIGSQLVNVLYILDEPSIGLHQRDNMRLIKALQNLRDIGNSVIVVEHDKEMIMHADYVLDIGPLAGINGGRVVASGKPEDLAKFNTITTQYLNGTRNIEIPAQRRTGSGKSLILKGAKGHNLKNVNVEFPLGKFICVSGVSGSGKSSLINGTLYPLLNQYFYRSLQKPLEYSSIKGLENIDKVIEIDQSPIGRTPRSNPATYTGVFTEIRNLFTSLPEAKIRGYKPGRFSFNVKGGRCETCKGAGVKTIEMNFLPDVYVVCETCQGKRYNRETLEIRYRGKSISDILEMTINQAVDFFENIPYILSKIKAIKDVGLGYVTLGQQSTTLSGGEAQRVKLATELSKRDTGNTFYILDEPTTGLHFEDIKVLLEVLNKLADSGNTILVIEHNLDIIKVADHVIDLGPEGGDAGGNIVCYGTPEQIARNNSSITGEYLKRELS